MEYQGKVFGGVSSDANWIFTTIMPAGTSHTACWENPAEERKPLESYGIGPTNLESVTWLVVQ
jgi:hypothetical protein